MIELGAILNGLVQRTAEGKVRWTRAAHDGSFVTSLDAISIMIQDGSSGYQLEILDESGVTVEALRITANSPIEQDEQLQHLYILARRSAHNIDATLEKLAKALDL